MAEGCKSRSCCQFFMVIWNLLYFMFAGVIFGIAIAYSVELLSDGTVETLMSGVIRIFLAEAAAAIALGFAILLAMAALVGISSTCLDNKHMLLFHVIMVGIVVAAQITAGALAAKFIEEVRSSKVNIKVQSLRLLTEDDAMRTNTSLSAWTDSDIIQTFDFIQIKFKCCGVNSSADYISSTYSRQYSNSIPVSCCQLKTDATTDVIKLNESAAVNYTQCQREWQSLKANLKYNNFTQFVQLQNQGCFDTYLSSVEGNQMSRAFIGLLFAFLPIDIIGFIVSLGFLIEPLCGRTR